MSHTSTIKNISIIDIPALKSAIRELNKNGLGITLHKDKVPRAFYKDQKGLGKADYMLSIESCLYDIGLYKKENEPGYELKCDTFDSNLSKTLDAQTSTISNRNNFGKLYQMYGIHAAMSQAQRKGYSCRRTVKEDGTIQLKVSM